MNQPRAVAAGERAAVVEETGISVHNKKNMTCGSDSWYSQQCESVSAKNGARSNRKTVVVRGAAA